jgi:hypothetical protein
LLMTTEKDVPDFWIAAGNPARLLRKIETTMDPDHPSNQRMEGTYGVEKDMAELADKLEVKKGEYDDCDQGW